MQLVGAKTDDERALLKSMLSPLIDKDVNGVKAITTCIMCARVLSLKMGGDAQEFADLLREIASDIEKDAEADGTLSTRLDS